MSDIHAAYMGHLEIDGLVAPCYNISTKVESQPLFFDVVPGLRDKFRTESGIKVKEDGGEQSWGTQKHQKRIWREAPWSIKGSFSSPVTVSDGTGTPTLFKTLFNAAIHGKTISSIRSLLWMSGGGYWLKNCLISTFTVEVTSGEVSKFNFEVVAKDFDELETSASASLDCSKLVTWDVCGISSSTITAYGYSEDIMSYSLTVNNPVIPIYTSDNGNIEHPLVPKDLRLGIQSVTGKISIFGFEHYIEDYDDELSMTFPNLDYKLYVTYSPNDVSHSAGTNPVIFTVPFYGSRANGSGDGSAIGGPVWSVVP